MPSLTGAWAERALFSITSLDSSEVTNEPGFTPQDSLTASTTSLHSQHSTPSTPKFGPSDVLDYKGQPLQGVWGEKGITGAAMIKSTLAPMPTSFRPPSLDRSSRSSSRSSTPIRVVSSGEMRQAASINADFSQGPRSRSSSDLQHQTSEWKRHDRQSRRGSHDGTTYQRSVSENVCFQQSRRHRGNKLHPPSEPSRRGHK